MKLVFVDAENVGYSKIKNLEYAHSDKVLVFSRNEKVKTLCSQKMLVCLSHYEEGSNQADFLIIATLSRLLSSLDEKERNTVTCELLTQDYALNSAFVTQCHQYGVECRTPGQLEDGIKTRILNVLQTPHRLNREFWNKAGINQSTCNRVTKELAAQGKIKRSDRGATLWVTSPQKIQHNT